MPHPAPTGRRLRGYRTPRRIPGAQGRRDRPAARVPAARQA